MKRLARLLLRLPPLLLVLTGGVLLSLLVTLWGWLGLPLRLRWRQRLGQLLLRQLTRALPFRVRIEGRLPDRPMLWVANHLSWVDIVLLGGLQPLSFLSKSQVRRWPLAGWLASEAGTLFIRRGAGDAALVSARLAERLEQGLPMLVFPEGTSHDGRCLGHFHGRLLGCAGQAGVDIQPVALSYRRSGARDPLAPFTGEQELLRHLLQLLMAESGEALIQLLPTVPSAGRVRNALAQQTRDLIEDALSGQPAAPSGAVPLSPGPQLAARR